MIPPTERQSRVIWFAVSGLAVAVLVGLVAALIWGLTRVVGVLSPVLWPLAIAGVLSYLLDPVVDFIQKRGVSRPKAIIAVFVFAVLFLAATFGSIVPQLIGETQQLASRVPVYAEKLGQKTSDWLSHPPPWLQKLLKRENVPSSESASTVSTNEVSLQSQTNSIVAAPQSTTNAPPSYTGLLDKQTLQSAATGLAETLRQAGSWLFGRVASWFGILAGLALIPVYAFYFLLEKEQISSRWTDYLPVKDSGFKNELVFILNSVNNYLIAFFRGQVLVAICDGVLYAIGFLFVGLPYALLIGVAAMFLTIIPFLGAIIICAASLVIAVVQFGDWLHPVLILCVFAVVQSLEGLVISPKIMGNRVGLHPVTIIIGVMVGTTLLGGLLGGILAIPLTAALRVLMFRYIWKRPAT